MASFLIRVRSFSSIASWFVGDLIRLGSPTPILVISIAARPIVMRGANRIADGNVPTYDHIDKRPKTRISREVGASCFHGWEAAPNNKNTAGRKP
jgi:hypothetical protein